ncbi:MAG: hypothetical protein OHK0018_11980 [Erythrobacter tepidarius]
MLVALGQALRAQDTPAPLIKTNDARWALKIPRGAGYKAKFKDVGEERKQPSFQISTRDGPVCLLFSDCAGAGGGRHGAGDLKTAIVL